MPTPECEECKVIDGPEIVPLGWGSNDWESDGIGYAYEVHWTVENPEDCIVVQFVAIAWGVDGEVYNKWGSTEYPRLDNKDYPEEARYAPTEYLEWLVQKDDNSIVMYDRPGPGGSIDQGDTLSLWFNAWPRLYSKKIYDEYSYLDTARWGDAYGGDWQLDSPPYVFGSSLPQDEAYHIHWEGYDKNTPSVFPDTETGMGKLSLP